MNDMQKIEVSKWSRDEWWRGAVIYQIYPRSFADSNGDGVGDLPGITSGLDYVASLGVDAIWLSPFFTSPMRDFGYDVADYCDVDPIFGALADLDALIEKAHGLGLKVIIDQVYSHTSDQHAWFAQSRSSRDNPKADWYVWADPKPDGSPPNNWQSVFGGPAWTWDARRGQYYMHNFLREQPQMNVHNPEVQEALLGVAKFWLDRGVDGFRVDAINFAMHDQELRDNPPAPAGNGIRTRPFDFQLKIHNQSHPDIPAFIERIRALTDQYPGRFTVAEVGGPEPDREMKAFTAGDTHFNSAYGFDFLYADKLTPALVREALESWPSDDGIGWPSWAFSNHDAPRWISRWASGDARDAYARMAMLLFLCLRGNAIIWQGEELGLTQVDIPFDRLQDPEAIANWPLTLSRDGTRTPMPWRADAPNCGFSAHEPWLPFGTDHRDKAIDRQENDPRSILAATRRYVALRRANEALRTGEIRIIEAQDSILVFERLCESQVLLCIFNFGPDCINWSPDDPVHWRTVESLNDQGDWKVGPYGALVAEKLPL
ncbi:MAG: alpha-glucosidase [Sphingomonadales bacterium]|jgi:alpha-glucosidase|nr:alpha-glucosidase [Sphingomonadales bacterium]MBK9268620.1 alpha-glucosidase [Sphingomonadales bacterium]MBP6435757.1 alpha-glucosidase [Sphingorhabdus sp.]